MEVKRSTPQFDGLSKTNTTPYIPTSDYHPATKEYVDAVASGGSVSTFLLIEDRYEDGYFERNFMIDSDGNRLTEEVRTA